MRYWTVDEANAALPRVGEVVRRIRDAAAEAQQRAELVAKRAPANGHVPPDESAQSLHAAVRELSAEGIVVRDPQAGLIDFPAKSPSGRPYWLCWVLGEPAVAFWHWPEEGFAGRTPLADPPV
jgi:hypothetical protein